MKIKLWVNLNTNFEHSFIIPDSLFMSMCKERAKELTSDEDTFMDWLMDTYTLAEVLFFIKSEEKNSMLTKEFNSYCMRSAFEELNSKGWYQKEIEIDSKKDIIE